MKPRPNPATNLERERETAFHLDEAMFTERERPLVSAGQLSATAFMFDSGVAALRLQNELGELIMLPYQGQQIWSARFLGRELTMRSMFDRPKPTQNYLETYGGFLLHCGVTAMGVPGDGDNHPLHGELPNAVFDSATILLGEDERGSYIALTGEYRHTVAFSCNYLARPLVKLYADSSRFLISLEIVNLKNSPMELMYMAHINFRPVDGGRLVYSAPCTPETVRVRDSVPAHVRPLPGYFEFLKELRVNPERHNRLDPDLAFDPEVVLYLDYLTDAGGWAHSLQVHPDGSADYVAHRPSELPKGVRWICRTPDQDALGLVLPATAEPEGYSAEKAKGNLLTIAAGARYRCEYEVGALDSAQAKELERAIGGILGGAA